MHGSQQWFPRLHSVAAAVVLLAALSGLCLLLIVEVYRVVVRPCGRACREREHHRAAQKLPARRTCSAVAHEIKNPLTAISVRLHTLQRALLEGSAEHEDALVIRDEINRLNRIVSDFLQLARPAEPELVTLSAPPRCRSSATCLRRNSPGRPSSEARRNDRGPFPRGSASTQAGTHQPGQNAGESIGCNGTVTFGP